MTDKFDKFKKIYTMNINGRYQHKNIEQVDTTALLSGIMYNDFYQIGK